MEITSSKLCKTSSLVNIREIIMNLRENQTMKVYKRKVKHLPDNFDELQFIEKFDTSIENGTRIWVYQGGDVTFEIVVLRC